MRVVLNSESRRYSKLVNLGDAVMPDLVFCCLAMRQRWLAVILACEMQPACDRMIE